MNMRLERKEYAWVGYMFDGLVPTSTLIDKISQPNMEVSAAPIMLGNVGEVANFEPRGVDLASLTVAFNNAASFLYVSASTYRGVLAITFHSQLISKEDVQMFADRTLRMFCNVLGASMVDV